MFCLTVEGVSDRQCPCRLLIGYTSEHTFKWLWASSRKQCILKWWKITLQIQARVVYQRIYNLKKKEKERKEKKERKIQRWVNRFCLNDIIFLYLKILCCHNSLMKYFISIVLTWNQFIRRFCVGKESPNVLSFCWGNFLFWNLIFHWMVLK